MSASENRKKSRTDSEKKQSKETHEPRQSGPYSIGPRDEWERELMSLASDCGVSLSDQALSRENLYD